MDRRNFLKQTLLTGACATLSCATTRPRASDTSYLNQPPTDSSDLKQLADVALDVARRGGASYADIRLADYRNQRINTREHRVSHIDDSEHRGFGVRVIAKGTWGFASSPTLEKDEIARVTKKALSLASACASITGASVELAPTSGYAAAWSTPIRIDPFTIPLKEKIEKLLSINSDALKHKGIKFCNSSMHIVREHKFFASTEGSYIEQTLYRINPGFTLTAVDLRRGEFQTRRSFSDPRGMGYEYIVDYPWMEETQHAAEDAVSKLTAPPVVPGKRDLILHPSHLWLTIHESIGHPTELDRACGTEANFAGTSFLTPDKLGRFQLGSEKVNIVADTNRPQGLASSAYDDDGVPTQSWQLVKDGVFVDYQNTRETALWVGKKHSYGCSYAQSWNDVPILRMANISLAAGQKPLSLSQLIADTEDGILIKGDSSYSIDHQRYNFQFSGQVAFDIKHGKITGMLKDVAYQSRTPDFWRSCDAVCSQDEFNLGGTFYCGKGEPGQSRPVSHGCAPARFRQINVINTRRAV